MVRTVLLCALGAGLAATAAAEDTPHYYAHDAVLDEHGVIAPWYDGRNGQLDERARIAADTLFRYPWADSPTPAPHYVYNGAWSISPEGEISIPPIDDWANGDLGQRAAYVLSGLVDYYAYSGDPAAIAHLHATVDVLLEHEQTPADHDWPGFLISVPVLGEPYGDADPGGFIQLDIVGEVGYALLRAYRVTGERRWLQAAARWGTLLAQNCDTRAGLPPWGRYANPEQVHWEDPQTGGVAFILYFLDELIAMGIEGPDGVIPRARDAGVAYLRDVLLPRWLEDPTWGRNYWDWPDPVQAENVTEFVCRYLMEHPEEFPSWRTDARNVLSLFLNRTSVSMASMGDVYSGAWAYPESSGCCGLSLWYGPLELAPVWLEYGARADDPWATEMGRRQAILATYDFHPTGVVEDGIGGGPIVAGAWFKIAHPMALKHVLNAMAWQPQMGASGESHILRSTGVVREVRYEPNQVRYVAVSPHATAEERIRLAFEPTRVTVDGAAEADWKARALGSGDYLLEVSHASGREVVVTGRGDPMTEIEETAFDLSGPWRPFGRPGDSGGTALVAEVEGAAAELTFTGDQVRILARCGPRGGLADVYIDGERQLRGLDLWCPETHYQGIAWRRSGLGPGAHSLRIVARGEGNPRSAGTRVILDAAQFASSPARPAGTAHSWQPAAQRVIFGYPHREDYTDGAGRSWRPATEWIIRTGHLTDVVREAWWTDRRVHVVHGATDSEIYRYGAHGREFTHHFTVPPGTYHLTLHFAETRRGLSPEHRAVTVLVNGSVAFEDVDILRTAGDLATAVRLTLGDVRPEAGVVAVTLRNDHGGEAICQALELAPGTGPAGDEPRFLERPERSAADNLLVNPGFEAGFTGVVGRMGDTGATGGWQYLFASPGRAYIFPESAYAIHPDWGLPVYHSGGEALRTHGHESAVTVVFQEVPVSPDTGYRASVWVRGSDLRGEGFGVDPSDEAVLRIHELDEAGNVVSEHRSRQQAEPNEWVRLSVNVTPALTTTRLRFLIETRIEGPYEEGHVTYDDAKVEPVEITHGQ